MDEQASKNILKKCNIGIRHAWILFRKPLKSLLEINDTKMRVYVTKGKLMACLERERMRVKNAIQTIYISFSLWFLCNFGMILNLFDDF